MSSCGTDDLDFTQLGQTNIRPVTDPELIAIAAAMNDAEISAGRTAEARLTNTKVKALAHEIIDAHSSANIRVNRLAAQASWFDSPVVPVLRKQSQLANNELASAALSQLDAAFLASEITTQAQSLTLLNCAVVHQGQDPLGAVIAEMRVSIETHLLRAIELRRTLVLPDNGEATVVGCVAMCARPVDGEEAPSLADDLKAAVCR